MSFTNTFKISLLLGSSLRSWLCRVIYLHTCFFLFLQNPTPLLKKTSKPPDFSFSQSQLLHLQTRYRYNIVIILIKIIITTTKNITSIQQLTTVSFLCANQCLKPIIIVILFNLITTCKASIINISFYRWGK